MTVLIEKMKFSIAWPYLVTMRVVSSRRLFCLSRAAFCSRARASCARSISGVPRPLSRRTSSWPRRHHRQVRPTWACSPAPRSFPHKTNSSSWSSPRDALNALVSSTLNVAAIGACAERGRDRGLCGSRYGHCRSASTRTQHKHITQSEISTAHRTILIALAVVHRRR